MGVLGLDLGEDLLGVVGLLFGLEELDGGGESLGFLLVLLFL